MHYEFAEQGQHIAACKRSEPYENFAVAMLGLNYDAL